ncbi:MAG TPA: phosphoglycerate mutase family protein [Acidimicrobiales bacterium]
MTLYVVRHAHAGSRASWSGGDHDRPLSATGRKQAAALAGVLVDARVTHLVSSPTARCTETLEPAATSLSLAVTTDARLLEGADVEGTLELADELRSRGAVAALCSHGDVIPELLRSLVATGARFTDPLVWPKASTWVITSTDGAWTTARYIAPPEI